MLKKSESYMQDAWSENVATKAKSNSDIKKKKAKENQKAIHLVEKSIPTYKSVPLKGIETG